MRFNSESCSTLTGCGQERRRRRRRVSLVAQAVPPSLPRRWMVAAVAAALTEDRPTELPPQLSKRERSFASGFTPFLPCSLSALASLSCLLAVGADGRTRRCRPYRHSTHCSSRCLSSPIPCSSSPRRRSRRCGRAAGARLPDGKI